MSSAILYLAIVVIWAFLLVPRWIRRPHAVPVADPSAQDSVDDATGDLTSAVPHADVAEFAEPASSPVEPVSPEAPRHGLLRAVGLGRAHGDDDPAAVPSPSGSAPPPADVPATTTAPPPRAPAPPPVPPAVDPARPAHAAHPAHPARSAYPPISRGKILQARRRLLTTLVALTIAALACTMLQLTSWWVCVPPIGMLGMYVLLLREAATADAARARWHAERAAAIARHRAEASERNAQAAQAAQAAQPGADIIDISARLTDQLYDQYADATVRAVGD